MPNLKISKILTHDTTFHADEVFAVALIKYVGYDVPLFRTRDRVLLEEAKADPTVFVIDVGGEYNPAMLNFDHHQDMSLPSAAGLVYNFLKPVFPEMLHTHFDAFFGAIDAVDTNRDNIYALLHTLPDGFRNVSSIISGFNRDVTDRENQNRQFNLAAKVAFLVLQNENHAAMEHARSEKEYAEREILPNNVAVFKVFNTIWKKKGEHQFAVMPHANGWQIVSADTSVAVVPEAVSNWEGFIFRHGNGFMATFAQYDNALEFAKTIELQSEEPTF